MPYEDWIRKQEAKFEALGYDLYRIVRPQDGELSEGDDWPFSIRPFAALRPETWGDIVPSSSGTVSRKDSILSKLTELETSLAKPELVRWADYVGSGETLTINTLIATAGATAYAEDLTTAVASQKARIIGYAIYGDMANIEIKSDDASPIELFNVHTSNVAPVELQSIGWVYCNVRTTAVNKKFTLTGNSVIADGTLTLQYAYTMGA